MSKSNFFSSCFNLYSATYFSIKVYYATCLSVCKHAYVYIRDYIEVCCYVESRFAIEVINGMYIHTGLSQLFLCVALGFLEL